MQGETTIVKRVIASLTRRKGELEQVVDSILPVDKKHYLKESHEMSPADFAARVKVYVLPYEANLDIAIDMMMIDYPGVTLDDASRKNIKRLLYLCCEYIKLLD